MVSAVTELYSIEKIMIKKYNIIPVMVGIFVLVAGCRMQHDTKKNITERGKPTVLTIYNQSSFPIKDITYNGQAATLPRGALYPGESCKVQLIDKASGYLYFTLYDKANNSSFTVRTHASIVIEKGKAEIFNITDNTLVVEMGKTVSIKILDLINIAILKVYNKTSFDILEISYGGKTNKSILASGKNWSEVFIENKEDDLAIKIFRKKDNSIISVTLKDKIIVRINAPTEVIITNNTLVVEEGSSEVRELRQVLGMGALRVINQTTAKAIFNISFAGAVNEGIILQGNSFEFTFADTVEGYIYFDLKNEFASWKVKTKDKINLAAGENKTFILTNDTFVIYHDPFFFPIRNFIYAAQLEIKNSSSAELLNIVFKRNSYNFGSLEPNGVHYRVFFEYESGISYPIIFEIKTYSGNIVKVKTLETKALENRQTTSFIITNKTVVVAENTGETKYLWDVYLE